MRQLPANMESSPAEIRGQPYAPTLRDMFNIPRLPPSQIPSSGTSHIQSTNMRQLPANMESSPAEIRGQPYDLTLRQFHAMPNIFSSQIPSSTVDSWLPQSPPNHRELLPSSFHTHSARKDELGNFAPEAMLQDLSEYITTDEKYPVARGGFGDIWKCTLRTDGRSAKVRLQCCFSISLKLIIGQVAVKAFRAYAADQLGAAETKQIKVSFLTQYCVFSLCVATS
jgi:hypothetical protein